ncbi:14668_t:CDS:2 [Ambispora leptoticha]|uniref:14668_t:CDS:1 n=1 Tax=Ambispora leptoticha TaxID=144679 RepID=A0A9N8Z4Z7_9GLOM|nr:14668_t:CDS:2 [Ambispora leptoticha]
MRYLIELLIKQNLTLASCESLTGSLFAAAFTETSGIGQVFKGGLIVYNNETKIKLVKVPAFTLKKYGAISAECAKKMAANTRQLLNTDLALSFTGNAGPASQENKLVGLVFIGLATKDSLIVKEYHFSGSRGEIRKQAVQAGINLVKASLEEATRLISEQGARLNDGKPIKPIPLPVEREVITVLISPHKYKDAQEQFIRLTHRRVIHISEKISQRNLEILSKLMESLPKTRKLQTKESQLEIVRKKLVSENEKLKANEKNLKSEEKRLESFAKQLFLKEELVTRQLIIDSQKQEEFQKKSEKLLKVKKQVTEHLEKIALMSVEEAKKHLFLLLKEEIVQELHDFQEEEILRVKNKVREESAKVICLALEKYSSELVFPKTTSTLQIGNEQIISRIIGKEGRNINAFRRVTGADLLIDKENKELVVQVVSFNSLRREIALQTLSSLVKEEKFSPTQIEKTFQKISLEVNELIIENGKAALRELELTGIHPELIGYLGKLKYRTSYGQNVLEHCVEVAKLSGSIAVELGLDVFLARRAGLFHDIGKSIEDGGRYSHVLNGVELARRYKEPEVVINAISSHHHDYPADNLYSLIVIAADKLSAARPGARGYQLEAYIERMDSLEKLAKEIPGVKKSYVFQAGREVWIIVDPEKVDDYQTWEISQKVKKKIKEQIVILGEVTIQVVREKKFTQKLNILDTRVKVDKEGGLESVQEVVKRKTKKP